jgi:hypothetical protein
MESGFISRPMSRASGLWLHLARWLHLLDRESLPLPFWLLRSYLLLQAVCQKRAKRRNLHERTQAVAMNEGYRWKKKLFSEQGRAQLEKLYGW